MLFTVGGVFSIVEGIHKLSHPEKLTQWWWAVGVLAFSIVAEGISTRAALQEAAQQRGGRSLWKWFRESRQAELIVIVGENIAAILGLSVALVAIVLTVLTGNPLWDALGTIVIGALLIVIAIFVAIEIKAMLIGQSIDPAEQARMRKFLDDRPEIGNVINLITLQMGNDVLVSVQAEMHEEQSARALALQINDVERALKREFPAVRWSFFEPDIKAGL
jgi:divalent metal cation (Fe/Co/Zn/Cd) transporter